MRLIALLAWYDEPAAWLRDGVDGLAEAGVDHLVAVDGAYQAFPHRQHLSPTQQVQALTSRCRLANVALTVHRPDRAWRDEMEKRTFMFRLADTFARPDVDWLWVNDADHIPVATEGLKDRLSTTVEDAASIRLESEWFRCLYRHQPGISVTHNHYTYELADGTRLWTGPHNVHAVPCAFLEGVRVKHRTTERSKPAQEAKAVYWKARREQPAPAVK